MGRTLEAVGSGDMGCTNCGGACRDAVFSVRYGGQMIDFCGPDCNIGFETGAKAGGAPGYRLASFKETGARTAAPSA
ncbi:MAG: hypothetical protein HYS81_04080 [Candidatus Aenigmatarchaeota archaeon]|nr:MAG: hypothetical protein HYS81_04080 [Candidatus Aenigmarchaeota archaeon]